MKTERNEAQLALEKLKYMQYGITDEQLDNMVAASEKIAKALFLVAALVKAFEKLAQACLKVIETQHAEYREEIAQSIDFSACFETLRKQERSRCYDRTETLNGYYNAKLKSYRNKINRAAIRRPRRIARSCC